MTQAGVEVVVADGFATIDFTDPDRRGPALAKLIDIGGGESIEPLTRRGPRKRYRVPEGNAREAGLLNEATSVNALASGDTGHARRLADVWRGTTPAATDAERRYPDDAPDADWTRAELDAYALDVKHIDTTGLANKAAVLDAIKKGTN